MEQKSDGGSTHSPLHELSNAMVTTYRELFGRGPAAARSTLSNGMAVCTLTDIYTPVERRLIEAGRGEDVIELRLAHQRLCAAELRQAAEAALGRPVVALLSAVHIDPDIAVEILVLERTPSRSAPTAVARENQGNGAS